MFRTLLLVSIAPLVIACQNTGSMPTDETGPAPIEEQIVEPTDGIANEIEVE